jgi:uncharacterized protein
MSQTAIDPLALLERHFAQAPLALAIVLEHSRLVAAKARAIGAAAVAQGLTVDLAFVEEGALLHDIGVCRVSAARIHCHGTLPYIAHGLAGREILEQEGLPRHALLCERHIGVGLTREDIEQQGLPLPCRDMVPQTVEERIVCLADLFFSKTPGGADRERSIADVESSLGRFGAAKVVTFRAWLAEFGCHPSRL